MSVELTKYQPNFDKRIRDLVHHQQLKNKIEEKYQELLASKTEITEKSLLSTQVTMKLNWLTELVNKCQAEIDEATEFHQNCFAYGKAKQDFECNLERLGERKQQYIDIFSPLTLVTEKGGELLSPQEWRIDVDKADNLPAFKARVTREVATHSSDDPQKTTIKYHKYYDYSETKFYYSDDDTPIQQGFVLFWTYNKNFKIPEPSSNENRYRPYSLSVGLTNDSGQLQRIQTSSDYLEQLDKYDAKFNRPELEDLFDQKKDQRRYELKKTISEQSLRYKYNNALTDTLIDRKDRYAFLLYPVDQGKFLTKDLYELSQLSEPKAVFEGDDRQVPRKVKLHCTLPEWGRRLRKKLNVLQQQIAEFNTLVGPHHQKRQTIDAMSQMVELHRKHAYRRPTFSNETLKIRPELPEQFKKAGKNLFSEIPQRQIEEKKKLAEALNELSLGINSIITKPSDSGAMYEYYWQKQHIERAAGDLWDLLSSTALRDELNLYINHIKELEDVQEGTIPAGPYMERQEEGWYNIFITLAECYAGLSSSEKYGEIAWEQDIKHGIETLGSFDSDDDVDQQLTKVWGGRDDLLDESNEVDDQAEFIKKQNNFIENSQGDDVEESVFSIIMKNYKDLIKPFLGQMIPGAGAPCTLQVVLASYDSYVTRHIQRKITSDAAYHIRFFMNIMKAFNFFDDSNKMNKIKINDLFPAFFVTKNIKRSNQRAGKGVAKLKDFFAEINEDKKSGASGEFYGHFQNRKAAYAKATYGMFNFTLSIQYLVTFDEMAKDKNWSEQQLQLRYITAWVDMVQTFGTTSMQVVAVVGRYKAGLKLGKAIPYSSSLKGGLPKLFNVMTVPLGIVQSVFSAYDAAEHFENEEYGLAAKNAIISAGTFMVTAGYVIRSVSTAAAKRWAVREAAIFSASAISAATGIGLAVAGFFIVAGTVINVLMFAWDMASLIASLTASSSQKWLEGQWLSFKAPVQKLSLMQIKELNFRNTNPNFDQDDELVNIYNNHEPYSLYSNKISSNMWAPKDLYLTVEPIEIIEDIHTKAFWENDSVDLAKLTWRAIIPLYKMGLNQQQIEEIVRMPNIETANAIKSVEYVIKYYSSLSDEMENATKPDENPEYTASLDNKSFLISTLLEQGTFTPPEHAFYLDNLWREPIYLLDDINEIETKK